MKSSDRRNILHVFILRLRIQFANSVISEQQDRITKEKKCPNKCLINRIKTEGKTFFKSLQNYNSEKLDLISMITERAKKKYCNFNLFRHFFLPKSSRAFFLKKK